MDGGPVEFDGLRHQTGQLVPPHAGYEGLPPGGRAGCGQGGGGGGRAGLRVGALSDHSGRGREGVRHTAGGEERPAPVLSLTQCTVADQGVTLSSLDIPLRFQF